MEPRRSGADRLRWATLALRSLRSARGDMAPAPPGKGKDMKKNAADVLASTADLMQEKMDETNAQVNVFVSKSKMPIVNQFVLLFYQSFLFTIDEYNLSRNEIRTVLKILEYTQFGNLIQLSYTKLAKDLNMDKANTSRIIKKLKAASLLIDDDGNLFLNPQIIAKGSFLKRDEIETEKLLEKGAELMKQTIGSTPNILTDSLRKKEREKKYQKSNHHQASLLDYTDSDSSEDT